LHFLIPAVRYADRKGVSNGNRPRTHPPSRTGTADVVQLAPQRERREILRRLDALPPLPAVAQEVLSIVSGDPRDLSRLEQAIRYDPALTSQLLKIANSAAYAPATVIDTVHRAIIYLGFREIRSIAFGLSVLGIFRPSGESSTIEALWIHSVATAITAKLLAVEMGEEEAEVFFTAGLLHDLGHLTIAACFQEDWSSAVKLAREEGLPLMLAEQRMGLSHTLVGAWLARTWGLPDVYVETIAGHHLPPRHPRVTRNGLLVQLADLLCHGNGAGFLGPPLAEKTCLILALGLENDPVEYLEHHLREIEGVAQTLTPAATTA